MPHCRMALVITHWSGTAGKVLQDQAGRTQAVTGEQFYIGKIAGHLWVQMDVCLLVQMGGL